MTPEQLYLNAARYATTRKNAYVEAMKKGDVPHMSESDLNGQWIAHYEGYREGYWAATGDAKSCTYAKQPIVYA